ncbi:MAG: methyltransferase domain-containing protein [Acidimicrobiales bacterium]|nr:methyltransferase domain-containing protein [Acidimicrobiales bacterium]
MRKRRKAELARLGEVAARLEAELAGVATEVRHTQALHDEFRTAAFAAWSAEVERLTTEFGERFSSAFEGIQELQGLSNALDGKINTVLYDLERTGSDVSDLSGRLDLAATAEQMASAFEGIEELQTLSSGLQGQVNAVQTDLERTGSDVSVLAKDMEAVGGLTKDVSALAKDMEAVGGLTKDVSALAKQSEKEQERFSETVTTVADQVTRVDTLTAGLAAIQRSLAAVTTSTASSTTGTPSVPDPEPAGGVPLDRLAAETVYAAIEDRLRGSPEAIRQQQSGYLDLIRKLPGSKPVADLGCGRGEFLSLLAESDIAGVGVDLSAAFVAECREQGLDVKEQDLLAFLGSQKGKSLRAVVSFQVLEHLPFPVLLRTYAEAFRVLVPGGLFLNETPNGANLAVGGSTFWLDHTHVRPLHPELLSHFAEFYGYTDVRVDLVSKPEVPWRLGPESGGEAVGDAVLGLQEYVLSGQDALLVAYRPREPRKPRTSKASTTRAKRSS